MAPAAFTKRNSSIWPALAVALACALVALGLMRVMIVSAGPPAQAVSADAFWRQVDQTLAWLDTNPPADSANWQTQAERWRGITEVTLPGQTGARVDTSYIVALLEANPPQPDALATYLSALKQTRSLQTAPGGAQESELLRQILARPEFREVPEDLNFIQRILQWLSNAINRLLDLLFGDMEISGGIPVEITIAVTALLLAAVLGFVFRDSLRNLFNEVELAEAATGEGEILSSRLANQKALELSGSGDYRHALRYLYLSALLLLDERGVLRYNRAQTNREYLRQVRDRPELANHLKEVVDTFDRVWYGYHPLDEAGYKEYAGHVTALEETKE